MNGHHNLYWHLEMQSGKVALRLKDIFLKDDAAMIFLALGGEGDNIVPESMLIMIDESRLDLVDLLNELKKDSVYKDEHVKGLDVTFRFLVLEHFDKVVLFGDFSHTETKITIYGLVDDPKHPEHEIEAWRQCELEHMSVFGQMIAAGLDRRSN